MVQMTLRKRISRAINTPLPLLEDSNIVLGRDYSKSRARRRRWAWLCYMGATPSRIAEIVGVSTDHVRTELRRFVECVDLHSQ